jgi:hypothetical protein
MSLRFLSTYKHTEVREVSVLYSKKITTKKRAFFCFIPIQDQLGLDPGTDIDTLCLQLTPSFSYLWATVASKLINTHRCVAKVHKRYQCICFYMALELNDFDYWGH